MIQPRYTHLVVQCYVETYGVRYGLCLLSVMIRANIA